MDDTKRLLIAGACDGLAEAIARTFEGHGWHTARACARIDDRAIIESPAKDEVNALLADAARAADEMGGLDALVNLACAPCEGGSLGFDTAALDQAYCQNFRAPYALSGFGGRRMRADGVQGAIVNVCGAPGQRADGLLGSLWTGLVRASGTMALELIEHGIRVNCITLSGVSPTDYDAIADAAYYLATSASDYVMGENLRFDGEQEAIQRV